MLNSAHRGGGDSTALQLACLAPSPGDFDSPTSIALVVDTELLVQFEDIQSKYDDYLKTKPEVTSYQSVEGMLFTEAWKIKSLTFQ